MKKTVLDFTQYKDFVNHWVENHPDGSRGQWSKIAKILNTSSVSVSHVFKGPRDLSLEQAHELCEYFSFSDLESEGFLLLVQIERAGTHKLKAKFRRDLETLKEKSRNLKTRLKQDKQMSEPAKAIFYSNWYYSAVRLATSIKGLNSVDHLSKELALPRTVVREVVEFLLANGLCLEDENGLKMGPARTHLESDSLLVNRHHANWRLKGIEHMGPLSPEELFYTGPMALSLEAMTEVRKILVEVIESVIEKVVPSKSETLACLNIDWYKLRK